MNKKGEFKFWNSDIRSVTKDNAFMSIRHAYYRLEYILESEDKVNKDGQIKMAMEDIASGLSYFLENGEMK